MGYDGSSSTSTSGTITGLVGGREYSFVVSALSRGGEGDVSDVLLQSTSPAAPTALASTVQTTTSISLSWTAPVTETGGAGVTGYVLYRNDGSTDGAVSIEVYGAGASGDATTTTSGESFEVTGLSGGVEYQFSVAARSSAGLGDRSEVVRVSTSSAKPDPPTATHQTASSITLSWSAPTVGTGEASTGYQVYMVTVAAGTTEPVYTVVYDGTGSEATSVELTSLDSGSLYTYVLSSLSAAGESDKSDAMSASTAPGVATGLTSTVQTTGSIALAWTAPTIPSGAAVTGYKVYARVVHSQSSVSDVFAEAGVGADVVEHFLDPEDQSMVLDTLVYDGRNDVTTATDPSTELNNLQGGSLYTYLVGALSDAGESDRSASLAVSTAAPAPTGLVSVSQTTTGMELSWTAPEVSTGEAVTGY